MINREMIQRFVKDMNIPIDIIDEPYFTYYISLYGLGNTLKVMVDDVSRLADGDCNKFLQHYYEVRNNIITTIEATDQFKTFINFDMNKLRAATFNLPNAVKGDVYKSMFDGKYFISIDLIKANYQVMKFFDAVLGSNSYDELIGMFTSSEYMKKSKYLRQVIFGHMNPNRQVATEKYFMGNILTGLFSEGFCRAEDVAVYTNDEIVLFTDYMVDEGICNNIANWVKSTFGYEVRAKAFLNKQIHEKYDFYVKEFRDGTFEFKKVPVKYYPQVYKYYITGGKPDYTEYDLTFNYEGHLARFLEPLF